MCRIRLLFVAVCLAFALGRVVPAAAAGDESVSDRVSVDELARHVETLLHSQWTKEKLIAHRVLENFTSQDPRVIGVLVLGLAAPAQEDRRFVIEALRRTGSDALPQLIDALESDDAMISRGAVITLGGMIEYRETIAPKILALTKIGRDIRLRELATRALSDLGIQSPEAIEQLLQLASDADRGVRLTALHALTNVSQPSSETLRVAQKQLRAVDAATRSAAIQLLRQLAPDEATKLVGPLYDATAAVLDGLNGRSVGRYDWPQWGGSWTRNNTPFAEHVPIHWSWRPVDGQPEFLRRAPPLEQGSVPAETAILANSSNIKWVVRLGTQNYGNPVVANGRVYIGTNNGSGYLTRFPPEVDLGCLLCFDEGTGKFLWQLSRPKLPTGRVHDWPLQGICASSVVDGDRLWVVTNRCELMCLDTNGFTDGENDGPFFSEPETSLNEADVVWVLDMIQELGVSPHNMSTCSPVLVDNKLFVCTSNGVDEGHIRVPKPDAPSFLAIDARSGSVLWTDNSPGSNILHGQWASPCYGVFGGQPQVIFPAGDGWVYSYDPAGNGSGGAKLLWKFDGNPKHTKWTLGGRGDRNELIAFPVIYDDLLYITMGQDPEHGEGPGVLWCIDPSQEVEGGDISQELAVDEEGNVLPPQRHEYQSPVIVERRLNNVDEPPVEREAAANIRPQFVPNPRSAVIWRYDGDDRDGDGALGFEETFHRSISSPAIKDDILYTADFSGLIHCLNAKTGLVYWTHDLLAAVWGSPVLVDEKVYFADEEGDVTVFRHSSKPQVAMPMGEPLAKNSLESPIYGTPVVANGVLFIATQRFLYSIQEQTE